MEQIVVLYKYLFLIIYLGLFNAILVFLAIIVERAQLQNKVIRIFVVNGKTTNCRFGYTLILNW
jgi:hypothetical protein